ncbi:MAG TPA: ribonuclease E inhibitor RraB [Amnibacterium sp.]|nr:ribonuclease E inhibitor RraB [Amnibacterium sp.]
MATPIEETLPQPEHGAAPEAWVAENLAELEEMNADSAERVAGAGAEAIRVEFAFAASTQEVGDELAEFLETEGDYEVEVRAPETETDEWTVSGTTPEVAVSRTGLDQWVRTMTIAGWAHGESRLDGWSALFE